MKSCFLLLKLLLLFFFPQVEIHADIMRPLVFAQVQDFKSPEVLAFCFQSAAARRSCACGWYEWRICPRSEPIHLRPSFSATASSSAGPAEEISIR